MQPPLRRQIRQPQPRQGPAEGGGAHPLKALQQRRGRFTLQSSAAQLPRHQLGGGRAFEGCGEIQALEGAGRTCFDFTTGDGRDEAPFGLKLDMARQCWDEARHVEISCKLSEHMGTEIGEFAEGTTLYEAACNADPVLRLTGVNRALEGLAIDVFKTMRDFGTTLSDPVLAYCEDWMLADEVTHVKMGSDWLRRITANDPQRQKDALEFQKAVDKLFSFGGFRGERDENPVHLARHFRTLAGFSDDEIDELVVISAAAYDEAAALITQAQAAMASASPA